MRRVLVLVVFIAVLAMLWRSADGEKEDGLLSGIKDNLAKRSLSDITQAVAERVKRALRVKRWWWCGKKRRKLKGCPKKKKRN